MTHRTAILVVCLAAGAVMLAGAARRPGRPFVSQAPPHARWTRIVEHAAFADRDTAEGFAYDGRMWLSNGYFGSGTDMYRDLWVSDDGHAWTLVNAHTPYPPYAQMVVFDGRMWAVKDSVWSSVDGRDWRLECGHTPFGKTGNGHVVVLNGAMWQLGSGADVWSSSDGAHWTRVLEHAPFGVRASAAVLAFGGKLWVLGGWSPHRNDPPEKRYPEWTSLNDVWSSVDGVNWTQVVQHAPWAARTWSGAAVYDQRMWLVGGFDNQQDANLNGTWSSADGAHWSRLPVAQPFPKRHYPAVFAFQNNLWLVAGNTWPLTNDVWKLSLNAAAEGAGE